jgi:pyruvate-ferredoxin/flavodoxin oxidoreductase
MKLWSKTKPADAPTPPRFPGVPKALDGSSAVVAMETLAGDAASACPIAPASAMGDGWAAAVSEGRPNVHGRKLLFFEPESAAASAAVTAGLSLSGLRATNFTSGPGLVQMHEALHVASGRRLTYVLNVATRALTRQASSVEAGHDDYHAVDDAGFFQIFARNVQEAADLNLVAHRIAELSLTPGLLAQDGYLTSRGIESLLLPESELIREYLGDPADRIPCPTKAQGLVFGESRRRIPEMFDLDYPVSLGALQNRDSFAQGVAAQRPFYFDHVAELADQAFREFEALTGRHYARARAHHLEGAEWVILGQGSVVSDAEAVAAYLRAERDLPVSVLNLTMFRPFPSDLIVSMLAGKKGVLVMERLDQPLSGDPPILREVRAAISRALENNGERKGHEGLGALRIQDVPEFYSASFGLGGRDLPPSDIVAAVENMLPGGAGRRHFYLGLDFVRQGTRLPKLQIWQESLVERYPQLVGMSLPGAVDVNLLPGDATAVRIHSLGGWGLEGMGRELAMIAFDQLGLQVKVSPHPGSEKKGQPVTCSVVLSHAPILLNCAPRHVDAVLCPDPNVFRHTDPLDGLIDGGVLILQSTLSPEEFWNALPAWARRTILDRKIKVCSLDALGIAGAEAANRAGRRGMLSAAFIGAFFGVSSLLPRVGRTMDALLSSADALRRNDAGFQGSGDRVRVMGRGFGEVKVVTPTSSEVNDERGDVPHMPVLIEALDAMPGPGHEGRFWEQVCSLERLGLDGIADPFAAIGAIPAATAAARDMTATRLDVPEFNGARCTGCGECFAQCPDSAILGLVNTVEEVLTAVVDSPNGGARLEKLRPLVKNWAKETHKLLQKDQKAAPALAYALAYDTVASKMGWDAERRAATDAEFHGVQVRLAEFPLARTRPYFGDLEAKAKGTGGLLSITVDPEACKGCNICVEVCPEGALVTTRQTEHGLQRLRRNWALWNRLPDTDDRFVQAAADVAVLPSLLLKKSNNRSMVGGDSACAGCGQKTAVHLMLAAIEAQMSPRVVKHVADVDALIAALETKARELLASGADLHAAAQSKGAVAVPVDEARRQQLELHSATTDALRDLRWRYTKGPSGKGRASLGMANSTGCSSAWAGAYPHNPYTFPWVNHLAADSPSVALGLFEAHMRKMAADIAVVRRASRVLDGSYDAARDEAELSALTWKEFTDEEFSLCPPILAMGGDGAMLDGGFQNLSRLLTSGKPVRVVVLDTQGHSDTGGQATTASFDGSEVRKEMALLAIAHRDVFVHQSSQASPAHLMGGVLKGLAQRRPALFNVYTPCPMEQGFTDAVSPRAARLALESRAFPFLTYDPARGPSMAECLSLEGNPSMATEWPTYTLRYVDDAGGEQTMEVPLTIADWAATEGRFQAHFADLPREQWDEGMPFDQYVKAFPAEREGKTAFVHTLGPDRRLRRRSVSSAMVALAEERLRHWSHLRQMAGLEVTGVARQTVAAQIQAEFDEKLAAVRAGYEAQLKELKREYPQQIARKLAEGLMKHGGGGALAELLAGLPSSGATPTVAKAPATPGVSAQARKPEPAPAAVTPAPSQAAPVPDAAPASPPAEAAKDDEPLTLDPYIDSARCTSCNECINLNKKMFVYNGAKQAEIKDPAAGTFQQLVLAAERCPVSIIHPGSPLNPNEKDLEKWLKRAEKFN